AHLRKAGCNALLHVALGQGENDGGSAGDEVDEFRLRFAAVGLGVEFVGKVAAGTAERKLLGLRVRQVDDVGGGDADVQAIDLVFELGRDIVTAIGARGGGAGDGQRHGREQHECCVWYRRSPKFRVQCHRMPLCTIEASKDGSRKGGCFFPPVHDMYAPSEQKRRRRLYWPRPLTERSVLL